MNTSKRYDCQVMQEKSGWAADIIRRVSSKKTRVTKHQGGFATESEAQEWAQAEAAVYLKKHNLAKRLKRESRKSAKQADL